MKIFFVDDRWSDLADSKSKMLQAVRQVLLTSPFVREVNAPDVADVILIQEKVSFKDFRYVGKLLKDPVISAYTEKVFTINSDDCATGLLRGLYTSLPKSRFNPAIHGAIPYMEFPNELVFNKRDKQSSPSYLATWRGNTKSNKLRLRMITSLQGASGFRCETTDSWLNHQPDEKKSYVDLMLNSKFCLCPAGWAPVSFRIYESMAVGRCPVILADEFVAPKGPNWRKFALFYPEHQVQGLKTFLRSHEFRYQDLGARAFRAWEDFFSADKIDKYYAATLMELIQSTPSTSKTEELKRWRSLKVYWRNHWTLPQRVINKARRWGEAVSKKVAML